MEVGRTSGREARLAATTQRGRHNSEGPSLHRVLGCSEWPTLPARLAGWAWPVRPMGSAGPVSVGRRIQQKQVIGSPRNGRRGIDVENELERGWRGLSWLRG